MQKLLDWFGVKDHETWRAMTLDQQREFHEKFARGFEKYLFEGRAPSAELQSMFGRFRSWLLHVYESMTELNVQLTDESELCKGSIPFAGDAEQLKQKRAELGIAGRPADLDLEKVECLPDVAALERFA